MVYIDGDGNSYKVSQLMYSQALQMVSRYNTSTECPDTSADHMSTHDVRTFTVKIVFLYCMYI